MKKQSVKKLLDYYDQAKGLLRRLDCSGRFSFFKEVGLAGDHLAILKLRALYNSTNHHNIDDAEILKCFYGYVLRQYERSPAIPGYATYDILQLALLIMLYPTTVAERLSSTQAISASEFLASTDIKESHQMAATKVTDVLQRLTGKGLLTHTRIKNVTALFSTYLKSGNDPSTLVDFYFILSNASFSGLLYNQSLDACLTSKNPTALANALVAAHRTNKLTVRNIAQLKDAADPQQLVSQLPSEAACIFSRSSSPAPSTI